MNTIFPFEKHSSSRIHSLTLLLFILLFSSTISAQITLGFQGGEAGDTWSYTSNGASALAISEATQSPNKVTGTTSIVVGGNAGGGNCWAGGSGNGPNTAHTFTFNSLDISSSSYSARTLTFNWGNRFPSCNGTGWDGGENLTFTAYHDGVAQSTVTIVNGSNNAQYDIQSHSYTWTIPPCVSQFYFVASVTTNRADELLFLDDVKLTAPQLNGSIVAGTITGNTSVCFGASENYSVTPQTGMTYTWSGLPAGASFTTANGTTSSSSIGVNWGIASPGNYTLTVTPSICGNTGNPQDITVTVLAAPAPVTISGPTTMCNGDPVTLTSSYNSGNSWSTGESTSSITITSAGTYTVSVATACGTLSASHTITLNTSPAASIAAGGPTNFCPGGSVTLTSNSSAGNSWSTGETTQTISVSAAGTYTLNVTGVCGQITSASQQITLLPLPNPVISGNTSYCAGQQTTLTASDGTSYQWSNGQTTTSITVTTPGTYTVTAFNSCGQTTSAPVTIIENPLPNPVISGNLSYCAGQQITLTASDGTSYQWSNGQTTTSITVTTPGTYTVTAFNSCGQTTSAPVTITENPLPNPVISGNTSFCEGQQTTLAASDGTSYQWSNGQTTTSITVTTPGTYTVTAFNSCGQTTSAPVTITENPLPNPVISGNLSYCAGQQTTLTASDGTSYQWSNGQTTTSITVTTPGTYTVTAINSCGQTISAPVTITENPLPNPVISGNTSFCEGQQTTLTASGGNTYVWSNGQTTTSIVVSSSATYTVTGTNACGQVTSLPVTVIENPLPNPTITGNTSFCEGQQTTLTASGGDTYTWSTGATTTSITTSIAGTYSVTAHNSCGQTTTPLISVTENPLPNPVISGNASYCTGQQTTLTASGGTSYQWSNGQTINSITISTPGTYDVVAFNSCGQTTSSPVTVTENSAPVPQITGNTVICEGQQTTLTASGGNTYTWSTGATSANINVSTAGTYNVSATNACGTNATAVSVIVSSISASFTASALTGYAPLPVNFTNTSDAGATGFGWDFNDGTTATTSSPSHAFNQAGHYVVELTATNAAGCSDTYTLTIEVLEAPSSLTVPNVFTPNGDNVNDQFIVQSKRLESYQLNILNRWGNVILTIEDPETGWDGTIHGDLATEGTYYYQITAIGMDNKNYNETGFFELQR